MINEAEAVLTNIANVCHGRPVQGLIAEFAS